MILTARIAEHDLIAFDLLRQKHFPGTGIFRGRILTMFHRLPREYVDQIVESLGSAAKGKTTIAAKDSGVRHWGAALRLQSKGPS